MKTEQKQKQRPRLKPDPIIKPNQLIHESVFRPMLKPEIQIYSNPDVKTKPRPQLPICPENTSIANIAAFGDRTLLPGVDCIKILAKPNLTPSPEPVHRPMPGIDPVLPICPENMIKANIFDLGFRNEVVPGKVST